MRLIPGLIVLLFSCPLLAKQNFSRTQLMMGDVEVTQQIVAPTRKAGAVYAAMEKAFEETRRLEKRLSEWQSASETSQLNRMAGVRPVPIGNDLMTILLYAIRASIGTDGAFDVTFASRRPEANFKNIQLEPKAGTAFLTEPGVTLGVSGIAKGYIVDRMVATLRQAGFKEVLVKAGGDLFAGGRNWAIELTNPQNPRGKSLCSLRLRDQAIATSGTYERGDHLIDPKTKRPALSDLTSASVIAPTSMEADALATGVFILGKERGLKVLKEIGGGILIDQRGVASVVGNFIDCPAI